LAVHYRVMLAMVVAMVMHRVQTASPPATAGYLGNPDADLYLCISGQPHMLLFSASLAAGVAALACWLISCEYQMLLGTTLSVSQTCDPHKEWWA
jgi:hypothetical protein